MVDPREELIRKAMVWSRSWTDQEPLTDEELAEAVSYFLQSLDAPPPPLDNDTIDLIQGALNGKIGGRMPDGQGRLLAEITAEVQSILLSRYYEGLLPEPQPHAVSAAFRDDRIRVFHHERQIWSVGLD